MKYLLIIVLFALVNIPVRMLLHKIFCRNNRND